MHACTRSTHANIMHDLLDEYAQCEQSSAAKDMGGLKSSSELDCRHGNALRNASGSRIGTASIKKRLQKIIRFEEMAGIGRTKRNEVDGVER